MSETATDGGGRDLENMAIADAVDRYIALRQTDRTDRTLRSYRNRLGTFLEWCELEDVTTVGELTPWLLDEYGMDLRQRDDAPATIKGRLTTLRTFLRWLDERGVTDDLAESLDVPTLDRADEQSDKRLATADAEAALAFFRESTRERGTARHALLELLWHTGARLSGVRALDVEDYDATERSLEFVHRPDTGTPLKNKRDGERFVGLDQRVCDALDYYLARERPDVRDDHGREPLFATRQGRASPPTIRAWSYLATEPCLWTDCPHGRRRETCQWTERTHASKCPSSRAPHHVRTGSITWQLNQGLPIETVATRVNASPAVIRDYYDAATRVEEFRERRAAVERTLGIGGEEDDDE